MDLDQKASYLHFDDYTGRSYFTLTHTSLDSSPVKHRLRRTNLTWGQFSQVEKKKGHSFPKYIPLYGRSTFGFVTVGVNFMFRYFFVQWNHKIIFHRTYSIAPLGISRPRSSRKYAPADMGFWSAKPSSGDSLHPSDSQSLRKYLLFIVVKNRPLL